MADGRKRGGQPGNQNARKHGRYARDTEEQRREATKLLTEVRRVRIDYQAHIARSFERKP